ncbi:MAG: isochorismatase family protein [Nitrososphaeraceae archaeon]
MQYFFARNSPYLLQSLTALLKGFISEFIPSKCLPYEKRFSSVVDTGFERMLRNAGIITIVFTGIATEFGVESSARDAFNRGFYSVVVSDCVSSPYKDGHDRSLENMKNLITVINSEEIENGWLKLRGKRSI